MTDEAAEDANSLPAVGKHFDAAYMGSSVLDIATETKAEINDLLSSMQRLLPYLTNMLYSNRQRQLAEQEMQRLSVLLDDKMQCYKNVTISARNLQYDFALNT